MTLPDDRVLELLRAGLPPPARTAPPDLWGRVQRRIHEPPRPRISTLDWLLLAAGVALCLLNPSVIAMVLLHL